MAGVYPVGMKMASGWVDRDLGLLVAILVGAVTVGSASPHLFNAFGGLDWRFTVSAASLSAAASGLLVNFVRLGPRQAATPRFTPVLFMRTFREPARRLANFGYLGHMWELYAMWAWVGIFLAASFEVNAGGHDPTFLARAGAFAVIGIGGFAGCLAGGWRLAFAPLALGPIFGSWAMYRLRARPEAARLAGGRR
ncbi:MAG: hypothetical protein L6R19_16615 [Alphaproteobacteria bacterium]|nr:hypothetical protein [Alphaproteobacteria bacterium]